MAEGQPDLIPMPGPSEPDDRGPMPESFERKLSPEEERALLVNFMGNMYGETKNIDSQIVGSSPTLERGRSEKIKQQIEQVISQPQQSAPQQVQAAPPPPAVEQPVVPVQQVVTQPEVDDSQLMLNFDVNEKDEIFTLIGKVLKRVDDLHMKVDELIKENKNGKVTSLPIKRASKKKSVESKEET